MRNLANQGRDCVRRATALGDDGVLARANRDRLPGVGPLVRLEPGGLASQAVQPPSVGQGGIRHPVELAQLV